MSNANESELEKKQETTSFLAAISKKKIEHVEEENNQLPGWLYIYEWDHKLHEKLIKMKEQEYEKEENRDSGVSIYKKINKMISSWDQRRKKDLDLYGDEAYDKIYKHVDMINESSHENNEEECDDVYDVTDGMYDE